MYNITFGRNIMNKKLKKNEKRKKKILRSIDKLKNKTNEDWIEGEYRKDK